ncbi:MAG: putative CheA signal transduction histidine kinase [Myxococcales bacterium]|nr:putative CheA signal transduction histidine kinase [Myxococcales bacterium]
MGIADLFRPKYRHSDVRVRTEAVRALTSDDAAILVQVARTDRDIGVRRIAIEKIEKAETLAEIAAAESERSLRDYAGERAAELWTQIACSDDAEASGVALGGIIKLGEQRALIEVAVRGAVPATRKRAFGEIRDPRALADLAKRDAPHDLRLAAISRIDDGDVLRALAIDTTQKDIGLAAVDKIDDTDRLENVAQKAKNKAVRQRARKIVVEMEEAEKAKHPGVPDETKRRRAEKAQLLRQVEAVESSFDFDKSVPTVRTAEAAWAKLGPDEGDERFTKSVERFWKRKALHDQTARTPDELRAIEREAARDKERAAAERAQPKPEPALAADDPRQIEREAEAKARREEREKQRLEDEAKRAAEAAQREVRRKEDAERAVAIAASLRALCEDLEKLAAGDAKDNRAVDRMLQQAAKAFDQVGRIAPTDREELSLRYSAARGKLVAKMNELREAEDWLRFANVPKAEALIQTAKQMAEAPVTPDLGNRLRQLQALWKEVGPMPQRRSKELWDQFKLTCDQVYEKVRGFRSVENEKFGEVAKVKEALIAEAEALAAPFATPGSEPAPSDWTATADKLKALQAKWKDSGHLPRKQGDELWKKFRAACDKFFERRKPLLDARHEEEAQNLAKKQALIARAQAVADGAPGAGGWGKAITDVKDLQAQWKEVGFVPRRDADAVYKAFRAACDALFKKRDEARDSEANAHRAELDAIKAEIEAVLAGGDDVVARAIAVRAKARDHEGGDLASAIRNMISHVIAAHADAVKGTELDPSALRARREKLIAKAEELLPKPPAAPATGDDIAAQLKQAMRSNAFGDLRFSGRDPIEVVSELKTQWIEVGPELADEDHAQTTRFEEVCRRVLDAAGGVPQRREERGSGDDRGRREDRGSREDRDRRDGDRGRRRRRSAEQPVQSAPSQTAGTEVANAIKSAPSPTVSTEAAKPAAVPLPTNDAVTQPAKIPFEPLPPPPVPAEAAAAEAPRRKSITALPPMDDLDTGWDMGDEDPTAAKDEPKEGQSTPSSSEMASDGGTGGDGIDEPGWD